MNGREASVKERADELRQAFDQSFALVPKTEADTATVENLLAVRAGSQPYVLRLADVAGLFVDKKITWLPGPVPELLGIAGFRGAVLPVYDLGMLLGGPKAAAPRWLVIIAAAPIGLAFEGFDGHVTVPRASIVPEARADDVKRHVREILQTDVARPIIHLPSVLETVRTLGGNGRQT